MLTVALGEEKFENSHMYRWGIPEWLRHLSNVTQLATDRARSSEL